MLYKHSAESAMLGARFAERPLAAPTTAEGHFRLLVEICTDDLRFVAVVVFIVAPPLWILIACLR
jgi:hypothetical protein